MKHLRNTLLSMLCLCLLTACGGGEKEPVETDWRVDLMTDAIYITQYRVGAPNYNTLDYEDAEFAPYLRDTLGVDPAAVEDGSIRYAGGVNAHEIAVFRMTDEASAAEAVKALEAYIESRAGAFAGYAPEQFDIVEKSTAVQRGRYAALLIAPDQDAAQKAFADCFTSVPPDDTPRVKQEEPPAVVEPSPAPEPEPEPETVLEPEPIPEAEPEPEPEPESPPEPTPEPEPEPEPVPEPEPEPEPEPPKEPWSYDQSRIVTAWTSGDRSGLYPEDLEILGVLDTIPALSDGSLTTYQKELALHDWMIAWAEYDPGALSSGPIGEPIPHNDNPYGFLTGKKGICTGYSRTFRLLMTLIGVECVTVPGTSHGGADDHAWNLVKLDGDWYAVDVTWDDPVASFELPEALTHRYFNVTSDYLRQNDHFWDESAYPEAAGTAYAWSE